MDHPAPAPAPASDPVTFSLILARGRNGVIGMEGGLPWHLPGDLASFRRLTLGKPVLMGRKTWDSLPRKPLPGRPTIVVSREGRCPLPGAWVYSGLETACAAAAAMAVARGEDEVFVIGGATLYRQCLDFANRIYLTEVDAAPAGDVYAPPIGEEWQPLGPKTVHPADARNSAAFTTQILTRTPPATAPGG